MRIELKWGVVLAVSVFLWVIMEWLLGFHDEFIHLHPYVSNAYFILMIIVLIFGLKDKKRSAEGGLLYKEGVISGFLIGLFALPLHILLSYIFLEFINPHYFENAIAAGEALGRPRELLEGYFNLKSYLFQTSFLPAMTVVLGAVIMLFLKTKPQSSQ